MLDVMREGRLLRAITVQHAGTGLGRQMDAAESAALHAAIDAMLQRTVSVAGECSGGPSDTGQTARVDTRTMGPALRLPVGN